MVDHRDLVGEAVGLLEVLRGEQGRRPAGDELVDQVPHGVAAAGVETRRRLVEEQHRRPRDQAHRDVEAAAHAPRVGARAAVGGVGEVEALEQLAGALARVGALLVEEPPDVLEVLEAGQPFVDRGVLTGQADPGPGTSGIGDDVDAVDRAPDPRRAAAAW